MRPWHSALALALLCLPRAHAQVTVYGLNGAQQPLVDGTAGASQSTAAPAVAYTAVPAYNNVQLQAPPVPQPPPPTQFAVGVQQSAADVVGLSIQQQGGFYGFSIEFSVVNQVVGINATFINVAFLNLMAIVAQRAGRVVIRVGGNSQETATLVDSLPDGKAIEKDKANTTNPTQTPTLIFTPEILYMMANVSSLLPVKWYLGIPFNDTTNLRLGIAEAGEAILGDNLLGFQLGNEPDLYATHKARALTYSQQDYFNEFGTVVQAIANDAQIPTRNNLVAPSVNSGPWSPESVWDTGFVGAYSGALGALAVEHYPNDNCAAAFPDAGFGPPQDPQTVFPNYLNHTSGISVIAPYLNSTAFAQQNGKPFLMFETNTASCGGFPGISDAFGAALWAVDFGMQMAYSNFSGALLHVGGEDDTYNPFTPPPTNMSNVYQWTIGPVFYSAVVLAEAFGTSGSAQIVDLQANGDNIYTPGYAIYEQGQLSKVALFNYVTDNTGASTYTASIGFNGGTVPQQVSVKYLLAPSVAEKTNITWAGQTLSGVFQSDGRFRGDESIQTVQCDQTGGTCNIQVPAPGFALVFLTSGALAEVEPTSTATFSTTALTKTVNTATVDQSVLATSNGHSGVDRGQLDSTSKGSNAAAAGLVPGACTLAAAVLAGMLAVGITAQT
ncbi:glycoside hydrolase family 79 protein [Phanerochaete sordida]|uniref:Glycoside hydrolase family 79 protein n=1 Tax=Phanerochaete sordida TaxID=48140 RepID=A0A9P3LC01_9APHY|nr:glycoside hydrolase family 79 protein [Phanerochaete sordida]